MSCKSAVTQTGVIDPGTPTAGQGVGGRMNEDREVPNVVVSKEMWERVKFCYPHPSVHTSTIPRLQTREGSKYIHTCLFLA